MGPTRSSGPPKRRRQERTVYTKEQLDVLKEYFQKNEYPGYQDRLRLATRLSLEEHKLQTRPHLAVYQGPLGHLSALSALREGISKAKAVRCCPGSRSKQGVSRLRIQGWTPSPPQPCAVQALQPHRPGLTPPWSPCAQASGPLNPRTLSGRLLPGPQALLSSAPLLGGLLNTRGHKLGLGGGGGGMASHRDGAASHPGRRRISAASRLLTPRPGPLFPQVWFKNRRAQRSRLQRLSKGRGQRARDAPTDPGAHGAPGPAPAPVIAAATAVAGPAFPDGPGFRRPPLPSPAGMLPAPEPSISSHGPAMWAPAQGAQAPVQAASAPAPAPVWPLDSYAPNFGPDPFPIPVIFSRQDPSFPTSGYQTEESFVDENDLGPGRLLNL
ncbi:tetrapeptide repeat homeobox protein 2-like [Mesoplodon densirostris]|uniref:tetrapeptide repeat homeobox protein 2-like n=1 Tax=Mesoplodon densirostris TaxID=48708 RepID=UPI0028DC1827|nr:tetrapeptide repeat homeobox protein 2-like [Mesoplodon densirostris]